MNIDHMIVCFPMGRLPMREVRLGTQIDIFTNFPQLPLPHPPPHLNVKPIPTSTHVPPMAGAFDPNQAQNLVEVP